MGIKNTQLNVCQPVKILFVEANLDGTVGGSHLLLLDLIKYLDIRRFTPSVVFFQDNSLLREFQKISEVIIFDKTNRLNIKKHLPRFMMELSYIKYICILFQKIFNFVAHQIPDFFKTLYFLKRQQIDIVHMNNAPYLADWVIACKILGIKCIAHLRGNWVADPINKYFVRHYDSIIAMSNWVTDFMRAQGVPTDNFIVIYDGIDMKMVSSEKITMLGGIETSELIGTQRTIGVVGNIIHWKGQHVLIEAMKLLKPSIPDLRCFIVGDTPSIDEDQKYFKMLKGKVEKYGLDENVIFTGFIRDIYAVVNCFDILVHTSTEPEPFGRVILEGMILEKPVIATAHGGPLEIIENGVSGFLVRPNNPDELAENIRHLLSNPELMNIVGKEAKKRVTELFDMEQTAKKIEALYQQLLDKSHQNTFE